MEANAWVKHFSDMSQGLVPYKKKYYTVYPQVGGGDVQLVTPTQAVVERAKMDLKRKLKEAAAYKPKRIKVLSQSGAGSKTKRTSKKKKQGTKKTKSSPKKSNKKNKKKKGKK